MSGPWVCHVCLKQFQTSSSGQKVDTAIPGEECRTQQTSDSLTASPAANPTLLELFQQLRGFTLYGASRNRLSQFSSASRKSPLCLPGSVSRHRKGDAASLAPSASLLTVRTLHELHSRLQWASSSSAQDDSPLIPQPTSSSKPLVMDSPFETASSRIQSSPGVSYAGRADSQLPCALGQPPNL